MHYWTAYTNLHNYNQHRTLFTHAIHHHAIHSNHYTLVWYQETPGCFHLEYIFVSVIFNLRLYLSFSNISESGWQGQAWLKELPCLLSDIIQCDILRDIFTVS